jgi:aldose 1-epimerase
MSNPNETVDAADSVDITLSAGEMRLTVSPYGASLRGLAYSNGAAIVTEYRGVANKIGGQGDVLIPFPGRVNGGFYTFDGKSHQMLRNDKETPSAIHGFLRTVGWAVDSQTDRGITFLTKIDAAEYAEKGYPFSLDVSVTYRATHTGMECDFAITNSGVDTAPVAAGFHPYFTVGSDHIDADELHVPFNSYLDFVDLIPTGKVLPVDGNPVDFRTPHKIGNTSLNTCYLNPIRDNDGLLRIKLSNSQSGRAVTVWMDESFDYAVLYSGDPLPDEHRRRALAIEPMTCGSDAFNHPEWGLVSLKPGDTFRGRWGVTVE